MTLPRGRHNAVACTGCGTLLPVLSGTGLKTIRCARCDAELRVELFPAFFRGLGPGRAGEALGADGESSCFYHERKRAAAVCEECGRFLCSLCEVRIAGRLICPACIERGRAEGNLEMLVTRRTLYDGIALSLSVLPLLFFFMTVVTAPMALFVAIRFWKKPGSILPRSKIRFILAILFASLQVAAWTFLVVEIANRV
jgi:LSD1 subclass zinc finger protein